MALDSIYSKTLAQRAYDNGRFIDFQWIKENEANDTKYNNSVKNQMLDLDDVDFLEVVDSSEVQSKDYDAARKLCKKYMDQLHEMTDSVGQYFDSNENESARSR